ncbi:hypothetical protein [Lacisediminihabitans profunda]|uniref:Uncharacterized protein n=1 Tax=Lacisediminihabitans profunda TaxID=2594790 RepID=A0A5C8UR12_9MICO|nr:hypothetical protein [Lacisediminihabitans profunda]TXN30337.1 hypothetical protein FVP33_09990 [Lacisediminihabitans profunda]
MPLNTLTTDERRTSRLVVNLAMALVVVGHGLEVWVFLLLLSIGGPSPTTEQGMIVNACVVVGFFLLAGVIATLGRYWPLAVVLALYSVALAFLPGIGVLTALPAVLVFPALWWRHGRLIQNLNEAEGPTARR